MMKNNKHEYKRAIRVKIVEDIIMEKFNTLEEIDLDSVINAALEAFENTHGFYPTKRTVKSYIDSVIRRKNIDVRIVEGEQ